MKTMTYLPLALLLTIPALAQAEYEGEVSLGARATHFASSQKSAKYDEYTNKDDGLFGGGWFWYDTEDYRLSATLDSSGFEITGNTFGLLKGSLYFDKYTHKISNNNMTPADGFGTDYIVIAAPVPPEALWSDFDYEVDKTKAGAEVTVDTESPFYYKVSFEQQQSEGIIPYGVTNYSLFEVAMPIDYTTNNLMLESGYRDKETTAVLSLGYSDFDNDNNVLTVVNRNRAVADQLQEYGVPPDNYSYNLAGRLRQQLPMNSLLAAKLSYTRNISEVDFNHFTQVASPTADGDFDGDVEYIRANLALTTRFSDAIDTRLFYNYVDRNNDSDEITATDNGAENHLYEYNKNQLGLDFNYRFDRANKLNTGYEFTDMDRNREDAESMTDNLLFGQLTNTSLDWMSTKLRLEYMNRDSDSDYSADTLSGDGLIHQYFTPFDVASKDRYKAKVSFEFYPMEGLDLGASYAFVYDDFDETMLGVQSDKRHEFYVDANLVMKSKIKFNTFAGYEYTESKYDARRYNPGGADPMSPITSNNYNWNQETTYDFFTIGGSITVPVLHNLDMVMSADYQMVDGNIDFYRSAATGLPALEPIEDADDYYKTQLGLKAIYKLSESMSFTAGYEFEKSNLDEWKYDNYSYNPGNYYYSGAGLDSDYEAHQFFLMGTYRF